jgi:hypothetical protein
VVAVSLAVTPGHDAACWRAPLPFALDRAA